MIDAEIVRQIRALHALSCPIRRIARELGVCRKAVRRYLRGGDAAEVQARPTRRALTEEQRAEVERLFDTTAEGNAVVVVQLLAERGLDVSVRSVQRAVEKHRRERRTAELARVPFETAPGHQMQIDFGEKRVGVCERARGSFSAHVGARARAGRRVEDAKGSAKEGIEGRFGIELERCALHGAGGGGAFDARADERVADVSGRRRITPKRRRSAGPRARRRRRGVGCGA